MDFAADPDHFTQSFRRWVRSARFVTDERRPRYDPRTTGFVRAVRGGRATSLGSFGRSDWQRTGPLFQQIRAILPSPPRFGFVFAFRDRRAWVRSRILPSRTSWLGSFGAIRIRWSPSSPTQHTPCPSSDPVGFRIPHYLFLHSFAHPERRTSDPDIFDYRNFRGFRHQDPEKSGLLAEDHRANLLTPILCPLGRGRSRVGRTHPTVFSTDSSGLMTRPSAPS